MKKLFVAAALALALTAVGQQRASAWCEFKFGVGFNISYRSSGHCTTFYWHRESLPGPCCDYNCGFACCGWPYNVGAGYAYAPGAESNFGGVAAQAPAPQPPTTVQSYNPYYNSGYQPVGYNYAGYANSTLPAYWYGR
jgi:hypothetical protein